MNNFTPYDIFSMHDAYGELVNDERITMEGFERIAWARHGGVFPYVSEGVEFAEFIDLTPFTMDELVNMFHTTWEYSLRTIHVHAIWLQSY